MRHLIPIAALLAAVAAGGAEPPPVSYFDAAQVRAAFAKGAVLFDGAGRNYMVHASRREQAGQGEVHTLDADVIYVLDGSATFVTGGALVEPRETAPNEVRGSAIAGGETRTIAKGDVIIVPAGTPHWFKAVQGPVLYYVVKVR
jgi:glc operon protein GlcG